MNGITVQLTGMEIDDPEKQPLLVTIVRNDDDVYSGKSCHLFAYTGKNLYESLKGAVGDYLVEQGSTYEDIDGNECDMDWFEMMAENGDYGEIFARHGLTEVMIPMGMVSLIFDNNDPLQDYLESR
jgi:hypothetical protein